MILVPLPVALLFYAIMLILLVVQLPSAWPYALAGGAIWLGIVFAVYLRPRQK